MKLRSSQEFSIWSLNEYPVVTPERFYRGSTMLTTTLSQVEWVGAPV